MSLIEFLIAFGIASAILAIAIGLLFFSFQNYKIATEKIEVSTIGSGATQVLKKVFSFSNKVIARSGTPITANIALGQPSELSLGSWTSFATTPPGTRVSIANIRRDGGAGATAAAGRFSKYIQTGIFYVMPTPTTSGVLFIDMGTQATMSPSYDDIFFDRLTELVIDQPQYVTVGGVQYLKGFHIKITARRFLTENKARWRWCPQADITAGYANCSPGVTFRDYVTEINILIPNQIMRTPNPLNNLGTAERMMGPIYFFPLLN